MGDIFVAEQDAHDKVIQVPSGVTVGVIRLTRNNITFRGLGSDQSTIKADNSRPYVVDAGAIVGGGVCTGVTLEDLTIDCDDIATMSVCIPTNVSGGPLRVTLRRVRIIGYGKNTIAILNGSRLICEDVEIIGNGTAISIQGVSGAFSTYLKNVSIVGGVGGVLVAGSLGQVPGIFMRNVTIRLDYWAARTYETVTPTAFSSQYVDVASQVLADRSLYDVICVHTPITTFTVGDNLPASAREWDLVEMASGVWTQVITDDDDNLVLDDWRRANQWAPVNEPTGTATIYRIQMGRLYSATSTRIIISAGDQYTPLAHWRDVAGTPTVFLRDTGNTFKMERRNGGHNNEVEPVAHGFITGDGPVHVGTSGTRPGGLAALTSYYVIRISDSKFQLATSYANALTGTAVTITDAGTGEHGVLRIPQIVAGTRMRILRSGIADPGVQPRDVDTGGVHITDAGYNSVMHNVYVSGGYSDMITVRDAGPFNLVSRCETELGQDMGFTVDGTTVPQNVIACKARTSGYKGYYLVGGPSVLTMCRADYCGLHDEGAQDSCGLSGDGGSVLQSVVQLWGQGGRDGLVKTGYPITLQPLGSITTIGRV
jgi:hypothetical protein